MRHRRWCWQRPCGIGVVVAANRRRCFPEDSTGGNYLNRERAAKGVCNHCPVLAQCREHALNMPETLGIWGALSVRERRGLRRRTGMRP
ncbi:WhiB family transcriptional regulator [Mycobacterium sp. NPDC003323]|uniref:WhiB family transcriptional regulator n=1 Tax=Mycolicibacterium neoaurum TaxID=1795 RepID=UPI001BCC0DB8|nr:WhiB family transcriptional regulator [Mycolicibacterium neoaurum]QVI27348.1 WhiB family transcriptional regulator [Mycolicibacterium neoaurum]